jgi:hypothetical protein
LIDREFIQQVATDARAMIASERGPNHISFRRVWAHMDANTFKGYCGDVSERTMQILQAKGYYCELWAVYPPDFGNHVVVLLPELDIVVDPTMTQYKRYFNCRYKYVFSRDEYPFAFKGKIK